MSSNFTAITYVGSRDSVGKEWKQRRWVFLHGKSLKVPDDFAAALLRTTEFVRTDDVGRPLVELFPAGGRILVRRWGALGDLFMFRACCAAFLRTHPAYQFGLRCQQRFAEVFADDPLWTAVHPIGAPGFDQSAYAGVMAFDQTAEADHRGDHRHRCELFLQGFTRMKLSITAEDWALPIRPHVAEWVKRHLEVRGLLPAQRQVPLIALQVRGSGVMKTLPTAQMQRLIGRLLERPCEIILIEPSDNDAAPFLGDDRVHTMTHRDALHGIEMLRLVDLAITMDSGALWMAHAANCKVLAILGPTRPEQRISLHPQYLTGGARSVQLNHVGMDCPACFEAAKACGGKFTCIQAHPDWGRALGAIADEAAAMLSADIRLPVGV